MSSLTQPTDLPPPARFAPRDQRALGDAFRDLAAVLGGSHGSRRPRTAACAGPHRGPWADPRFEACRRVAEHLGIELRRLPSGTGDTPEGFDLVELCERNHLRCRQVELGESWWRRDAGPIVGIWKGDGDERWVALLPTAPGRYEMVDPASAERRPLTARVAAGLATHGWVLYRPLPSRPLGWLDLVRTGWRGLGRDFAVLLGVSLASGLLALAVPVIIGRLVDRAILPGDRLGLAQGVLALIVAALAGAVFQLAHGLGMQRLKSRLDGTLQAALWDRLLALPVAFFRRFSVGDMGARAMGLERVRGLLTGDVTAAALALLTAAVSWGVLLYYSWPLALLATAAAAVLVAFTAAVAVLELRQERQLQRLRGRLASLMYALLGGIEKLRLGQGEARAFTAWAHRFAEQRRHDVAGRRLANARATFNAVYAVVGSLGLFAMVALSGGGGLSIGEFLAFHAAYGQFQAAVFGTVAVVPTFLGFVPIYERIRPILETVPESDVERQDPGPLRGEIELRDVSFRYGDDGDDRDASPWVLDGVSWRIEPGELVALVGPSGSGKSTCLRLLLGFETPSRGAVLYDGQDLETLDRHLVRRQIGAVLQHHQPMGGDLLRNILGSRPLTMDDAWRAVRQVGLAEEIERLPMGLLTPVNRRGLSFSGGQRQRLLIARAIVHRPRILLLDEATSALDNRTQDLVTRSLESLAATRLVIAHRLSTVRNADRILVLEKGRVVEAGSYDELIEAGGLFRRMARRQRLTD